MAEEYISREAAKRKYCETCNWYGTDLCNGCETPMSKIPAADVAPVKHGRWIHKKDKRWMGGGKTVCSVCESELSDGGYIAVRTFSYCPECGAKMDGGETLSGQNILTKEQRMRLSP